MAARPAPRTLVATRGLVLGRFALGEADDVAIVLADTLGQVRVHTPGAKSSLRMHGARVDTGNMLQLELRPGGSFFHTQGVRLLRAAPRGSLAAIAGFGDFLRLLRTTCPEGDEAHAPQALALADALSAMLSAHAANAGACRQLVLAAITRHITALGFLPLLNTCADTAAPLRDAAALFVSPVHGLPTVRSGTPLPVAAAKALYFWQQQPLGQALALAVPGDAAAGAQLLLARFAEVQLGHRALFVEI